MTDIEHVANQLRRGFRGEAWYGPAVMEVLAEIAPAQASARPVAAAHTIHELVLHMAGAYLLVLRRLERDHTPFAPDEDWPLAPPTTSAWAESVALLERRHERLLQALASLPRERLHQRPLSDSRYTLYEELHGLVQHDAYHAGQIVLLRRAG